MKNLYDVLGIDHHASFADIEHSYRHSLNEHIAGNNSRSWRKKDQLRLQQMRQAYLLLSSPSQRLEYDLKLEEMERARLRKIERAGTAIGLLLLIAGLALIGRGFYRMHYELPQAVSAGEARLVTVLAAGEASARPAGQK